VYPLNQFARLAGAFGITDVVLDTNGDELDPDLRHAITARKAKVFKSAAEALAA
jgi:hypothetical protein